eukprot:10989661-Alexandrium_andersonii.AAC.1
MRSQSLLLGRPRHARNQILDARVEAPILLLVAIPPEELHAELAHAHRELLGSAAAGSPSIGGEESMPDHSHFGFERPEATHVEPVDDDAVERHAERCVEGWIPPAREGIVLRPPKDHVEWKGARLVKALPHIAHAQSGLEAIALLEGECWEVALEHSPTTGM